MPSLDGIKLLVQTKTHSNMPSLDGIKLLVQTKTQSLMRQIRQFSFKSSGSGTARKIRFGRVPPLWRSAGIRLAGFYALMFAISAFAMTSFLWWNTAGLLNRQVETAIVTDAKGLSATWQAGGIIGLISAIQDRLVGNVDDDSLYLLTDGQYRPLTGNLRSWPTGVAQTGLWYELSITRAGQPTLARVERFDLPGSYHLLIGRDVQTRSLLRNVLAHSLVWGLALVLALGAAGGVMVRIVLRRMLGNVSATARAIAGGDLSQRVKLSKRGDEFDQLATTINDMLDRISRLMDGVLQVSNAIAHDLRTPITRARVRLEDANRDDATVETLRAAIDRATSDLDGVVSVFQALLRIAEIESGARRSAFATIDLIPLLTDLAELYEAVAEESGKNFKLTLPASLTTYGDRDMIQQALAHLLDNALKYSPTGASVELRATGDETGVKIQVIDQGIGMSDADLGRATERFFRADAARNSPGLGLGLALVQAVALLHGRGLELAHGNPGLIATLHLPRAEPAVHG